MLIIVSAAIATAPASVAVRPRALLDERHHGDVAAREVRRGGGQAGGEGRVRGALALGQVWIVPGVPVTLATLLKESRRRIKSYFDSISNCVKKGGYCNIFMYKEKKLAHTYRNFSEQKGWRRLQRVAVAI